MGMGGESRWQAAGGAEEGEVENRKGGEKERNKD
jgi:hypothetical protein